jgi:zinc transporter ZupT
VLIGSVLLGGILVSQLQKSANDQIIKLTLAFSGGFLLSIGFIHFIPELYEHAEIQIGVYVLIGFLIQLLLEFFSGGIEHGHVHIHENARIPFALILALSIHSIIEGIPLGGQLGGHHLATLDHHYGDQSLLYGIALHRLPVAIAFMTLLYASKIAKVKAWIILVLFSITASIGLGIGYIAGGNIEGFNFNMILAVVVGMFLHISTTIIFETSENHKFNFIKLFAILTGGALAFLIH